MGNSSSCFYSASWKMPTTAKLLGPDGSLLRRIQPPTKAAEIMLEEPGYVLSPMDDLNKTRHISAMGADDELLAGKIYLLVPLGRVRSKLSKTELDKLELASKKRSGPKRRSPKVRPETIEDSEEKTGFAGHQFGKHRRWNPVLETIAENSRGWF